MSMQAALVLAAASAASFACTWWLRGYALRERLLDVPNARSSHSVPTPRGGGAAIAATFLIGTVAMWLAGIASLGTIASVTAPGAAVAAIGFLDDRGHVAPAARLLVHFAAAAWASWWLRGIESLVVGSLALEIGPAGIVLATVTIVWILNLYNFMDGIDGLAGSELIFVAAAAAWLAGQDSSTYLPFLLLAGAGAGFLALNWPPARIFMGDVGSGFVGFALAALALAAHAEGSLPIWGSATLLGVFVADATVTLLVRLARGENVLAAHRSHAYQRMAIRCGAHRPVTVGTWAINLLWLLPWAWLADAYPEHGAAACGIAVAPLVVLALVAGAGRAVGGSGR